MCGGTPSLFNMGGCFPNATWVQAEARCRQYGARLCTLAELPAARHTGCGFDEAYVWVWESCNHGTEEHDMSMGAWEYHVAAYGLGSNYSALASREWECEEATTLQRGALLRRRGERPAAVAAAVAAAAVASAVAAAAVAAAAVSTAVTAALPTAAEPTAAVATPVAASDAAAALAAAAVPAALAAAGALLPELGAHVRSARLGVPARVRRLRELRRGDGRLPARRAARGRRGAVPCLRRPTVHALGAAGDAVQRLRL